ncbi:MAG: SpoIID/LytB domain-containing protein [Nitrospinota bacterium]
MSFFRKVLAGRILLFSLSVALGTVHPFVEAEADLPIRILLLRGVRSAGVSSSGSIRIYSLREERLVHDAERGDSVALRATGKRVRLENHGGVLLPPGGARFRAVGHTVRLNGRPYRGAIDVVASGDRLWVVNTVRLEDYLRGVVGREVPPRWPQAALQAQAVAARTFTLLIREQAERAAGGRPLFHLTAGTRDQVYGGIPAEDPAVDAAVRRTEGQVLVYRGTLARTFFHAASGGHTEAAQAVWPQIDDPYLRGVSVPGERRDGAQDWEVRIEPDELRRALARRGRNVGAIRDVRIKGRTPSGRATRVLINHRYGQISLPATRLRRVLGYTRVRSTLFALFRDRDSLVFRGRGFGHGVGMSQQGARWLAESGMSYAEILVFFYPGTSLRKAEEAAFPDDELLVPQDVEDLRLLLR